MGLFGFLPPNMKRDFALVILNRRRTLDWLAAELATSAGIDTWQAREALLASLPDGLEARLDDGAEVMALVQDAAQRLGVSAPALVPPTVN